MEETKRGFFVVVVVGAFDIESLENADLAMETSLDFIIILLVELELDFSYLSFGFRVAFPVLAEILLEDGLDSCLGAVEEGIVWRKF